VKWTVVWLPEAQRDLADLWLAATDRQTVRDAADWIDKALARDPDRTGIIAADGRFLERVPLAVAFEILPDDCLVRVLQVVRTD
jgi:hypothetical protein